MPRRSLRRAVLLALCWLALVVVSGVAAELSMARSVHLDVVRLFEELREVALARAVVEELRGVATWQQAVPDGDAQSHPLVMADVRQHCAAATATLQRFARASDPSAPEHDDDERALFTRVRETLQQLRRGFAAGRTLGEMEGEVTAALHAANAIAHAVDSESRQIGAELDRRTDRMFLLLVVLGIASVLTVGALGWLLSRRVLQPVEDLRAVTERFGQGELDLEPAVHRNDELGQLAHAFGTMAGELHRSRVELERRVEERSKEVLRSARLAELGTLAAGIAHEINNPLASIVACSDGMLRDLERGGDGRGMAEYLQILRKEAMRARDITSTLLRLAHQDERGREVFDIGEQASEVVKLFAHQAKASGVTVRVDCAAGEDLRIEGDPAEWRQVFFNLLRNALDASPSGGSVDLRVCRRGADLEITLCDAGSGIPPELRERVFEPFFTTKSPGAGTGLGLAIVHRIVTAHGGHILVDDGDPGARITIRVGAV
ncbi:MAG TPA: HAMP domain-containing histidine kinase [bacterium]|nr:HAMP domain-containing histidine kinase [bacterium]